ncbi:MAG: hypothetical protein GU362_04235 [Thaumarchaeota archaeon]|jgi:predicted metal-binding transcription factor (methanogenesis marker protein 9)|nr:hypothetical protein [Nitrososphaerota archaeon]
MPRKSSKDLLKRVVEETLAEYGGEPVKNAVIFYLTKMHGIRPEDVIQKPEEFVKALNDIYGSFEKIIETVLCEKIAKIYGLNCKNGFIELIKELKKK